MARTPLWQRKEGKSPTGGLTPAGSKSAGVDRPVTQKNNTGKDRLSLALRKWNCRMGGICGPNSYKTGGFLEPPVEKIFE